MSDDGKWCLLCCHNGFIQLYSTETNLSQILTGHAASFAVLDKTPGSEKPSTFVVFEHRSPSQPIKLSILELDNNTYQNEVYMSQTIPIAADASFDFAVSLYCTKNGIAFMITHMGYIFLFDILTAKTIYRTKVQGDLIISSVLHSFMDGVLFVTRTGRVILMKIAEEKVVPFVTNILRNKPLAMELAYRLNITCSNDFFLAQFNDFLFVGDVESAARIVAKSPNEFLRTSQTIASIRLVPQDGESDISPILQYFTILSQYGKLNESESIEFAKECVHNEDRFIKWLKDGKLTATKELGEFAYTVNENLALNIFMQANIVEKVVQCCVRKGKTEKLVEYAVTNHCAEPILEELLKIRGGATLAVSFAIEIFRNCQDDPSFLSLTTVVDKLIVKGFKEEAIRLAATSCTATNALNTSESSLFIKQLMKLDPTSISSILQKWFDANKLEISEEVGDLLLRSKCYEAASDVFAKLKLPEKVKQCCRTILQCTNEDPVSIQQTRHLVKNILTSLEGHVEEEGTLMSLLSVLQNQACAPRIETNISVVDSFFKYAKEWKNSQNYERYSYDFGSLLSDPKFVSFKIVERKNVFRVAWIWLLSIGLIV